MYEPDTILALKTPHDPDPETGEPFPYNRVRVVGPSPIDHGLKPDAQWSGVGAQGVVIVPLSNFGGVLDEPFGKLAALYDVVEVPEEDIPITAPKVAANTLRKVKLGPTPEEVFASEAPGVAPEDGQIRGRTPLIESPLEDPRQPASTSPLDAPPNPRADAERASADGSL